MAVIPTITFQILGQNEGAAEGSTQGLWFKLKSQLPSTEDLIVGLRVLSSNRGVKQSGVIMNLQHETHSADFFYKTVLGELDLWIDIQPFLSLTEIKFPIFANEGNVLETGYNTELT